MSSKITVKSSALLESQKDILTLLRKLSEIGNSLTSIKNSLDSNIKSQRNISKNFEDICELVYNHERSLKNLSDFLYDTAKTYENAEKQIKSDICNLSEKKSSKGFFSSIFDKINSLVEKAKSYIKDLARAGVFGIIPNIIVRFDDIKKVLENKGVQLSNTPEISTNPVTTINVDDLNIPPLTETLSFDPKKYSEDVLLLQKRLNVLGYTDAFNRKLDEDGYFGENTLAAVNKYKEENELWNFGEYAGKVGETTWRHLFTNPKVPYTNQISIPKNDGLDATPSNTAISQGDISDILFKYIDEYVNFTIDGKKVKIPYYITPKGTNLYGGKSTPEEIRKFILNNASDPSAYQSVVDANKRYTGIDCSGFVAYVLNEATGGKLLEEWGVTYSYGISAANLTSTQYGKQITQAKDIVPGCTIRTDKGGHVILVYDVVKINGVVTEIKYAHSNGSKGPHLGSITIGDENQDLNGPAQTWNDIAYTDAQAKKLYTHTVLLNCVKDSFILNSENNATLPENNQNTINQPQITPGTVTLDQAKKIAKEITATFEGGMYALAGNFDDAGLSIGYLQYNFKSGSLQPLLDKMANGADTKKEFEDIFNFDVTVNGVTKKGYEIVREVLKKSTSDQIAWGNSISNPKDKRYLIEPWKTAFSKLVRSESFIEIQDTSPVTIGYYNKATEIMESLGLKTVRGYALAFDISVNNGSISNNYGSWDLINNAMNGKGPLVDPNDPRFNTAGLDPKSKEYVKKVTDQKVVKDLLEHIKDVTDPTLRKSYFAGAAAALQKGCAKDKNGNWVCYSWDSWTRKIAILEGSGIVHGSEFSNPKLTDDYIK